ncbi:mucin-1 [Python bivittatus]|uniref:Mucin-1 n=1 Tax=Python bivittatus TaxID=176946 RepID=A0A9F5N287_PYTBI|nr:mucin-1 [Python bivittatus]XP_025027968.1 mucin-1 [Python bivittatus]
MAWILLFLNLGLVIAGAASTESTSSPATETVTSAETPHLSPATETTTTETTATAETPHSSPATETNATAETPHLPPATEKATSAVTFHSTTKEKPTTVPGVSLLSPMAETVPSIETAHTSPKTKPTDTSTVTPEVKATRTSSPSSEVSRKPSPTPSRASSAVTTTPPFLPLTALGISYRITNREFNDSLQDPNSGYYIALQIVIGKMYRNVYSCSSCPFGYTGFRIILFSQGSVAVQSELFFHNKTTLSMAQLQERLRNANTTDLEGLELKDVKVSATNPIISAPETVPGWGIALLVLVCILVFVMLLALLWLLIYWCRRKHRGSLELLSSKDSYHPMNEYPTYQTHSRYMAPGNKQNPYNETLPKNGARPFSYTNPAMANDDL